MENRNAREAVLVLQRKKKEIKIGMSSFVRLFTSPHTWLDWLRPMFFFTVFLIESQS